MFSKSLKLKIFILLFIALNTCVYSEQRIKDFYLSNFKEDGSRDWEMEGREAIIDDIYVDIDKMRANYYLEKDTILITSDQARLNKENMEIYLKSNVHIENKDGATLLTDSLKWDRAKNHIETKDWVKTVKDDMQITAKGLSADTEFKKADFGQDVEVKFSDKNDSTVTTITCSGPLEIEYETGHAVFNQDVVATHPQGVMFSDKATLIFDTEEKEIIKIISEGNVRITRDDNVTFAKKATYYSKEQRIVLEGRPRVVYFPEDNQGF